MKKKAIRKLYLQKETLLPLTCGSDGGPQTKLFTNCPFCEENLDKTDNCTFPSANCTITC